MIKQLNDKEKLLKERILNCCIEHRISNWEAIRVMDYLSLSLRKIETKRIIGGKI
jgi:hypothetical protein